MIGKIYKLSPVFIQEFLIFLFNFFAYKKRYGSNYKKYLSRFKSNRHLTIDELKKIQRSRFDKFLKFIKKESLFYSNYKLVSIDEISKLPILNKEDLRNNIQKVYTLKKTKGIISKTGGTTGKSLEVIFTKENMQERFAMLDDFRSRFKYKFGKKTAWFSGKDILTLNDLKKKRFWKTDRFHNIRYYSTFHIKEEYLKYYIENLITYKPEYFVGFPSTILEIARYGLNNGYEFPKGIVKAIFPTAETITDEMRYYVESFFHSKMYNQYASSEGAPFIFECKLGNLHLELQSGVFEVLDEKDQPSYSGRLIVTSFTTEGTPLIRYDIGDSITLEDENVVCGCGNSNPMVREILGRIDDFIYSPENGKINLGNVSNTLKDTKGIVRFQVVQNFINVIDLFVVKDDASYSDQVEKKFKKNWRDRIGKSMVLNIHYVKHIPVESSGKYRMVKNNIKHLI